MLMALSSALVIPKTPAAVASLRAVTSPLLSMLVGLSLLFVLAATPMA